jgi:membrane associated rhomboid family serine protease/Tfp pilus assembly protein PilF
MLILPVGQSQTEVRRHPWVTYTIIAVNIFFYLLVHGVLTPENTGLQAEFGAKVEEIVQFLVERPYLEPPKELLETFGPGFERALAIERGKQPPVAMPDDETIATEQEQLDDLLTELWEIRDRTMVRRLGFTPAQPGFLTLLTCMFVHSGFWHLFGNMLFLFVTGPFLEDVFGRPLYGLLYVLGGMAATGMYALRTTDPSITLIGASGAVAAVMGAFLIRLGTARIKLLIMPIPILWMVRFIVSVPAFVFLPLWFGEQLLLAQVAPEAGVAFWAHVGGFLFGMAVAGFVRLTHLEERVINPAIEREISIERHPSLEPAIDARARGDFEKARRELRKVLRDLPNDRDTWTESFRLAVDSGNLAEAGRLAGRVVELHARANELDLAASLVDEALQGAADQLPPRFYLSAAQVFERRQDFLRARELYEIVTQQHADDASAFWAHFRRGRILQRAGDPRAARDSFERARAHPACTEPQLVDRALSDLEKAERLGPSAS